MTNQNSGSKFLRVSAQLLLVLVISGCQTSRNYYRAESIPKGLAVIPQANPQEVDLTRLASVSGSSEMIGPGDLLNVAIAAGLGKDDLVERTARVGARRGLVTVLNAPGTGLFNSRKVSRLIPQMIRFYLGKEPALPTVPTIDVGDKSAFRAATKNMSDFIFRTDNSMDVLKPLVAESATRTQKLGYFQKLKASPENFVIRRTLKSVCGDHTKANFSFRTFCVGTSDRTVLRGGIQRSSHADGTPTGPVTQDSTAIPIGVE